MKKIIFIALVVLLQCNYVIAGQKPELLGFECKKEFKVGVPGFDGIQITSGSSEGGVIKNFILSTGSTKDGYPTSAFKDYLTSVDDKMRFVLIYYKDSKDYHGVYRYYKMNVSITKPIPNSGEWSDYNNKGILSEAVVGNILISANEYSNQPESCRIKLLY